MGRLRTQIRKNWPLLGLVVNRSFLHALEAYLPLAISLITSHGSRRA